MEVPMVPEVMQVGVVARTPPVWRSGYVRVGIRALLVQQAVNPEKTLSRMESWEL